jgi:glycosyltransferase involved in cell wall biosynthesis
MKISVIVPVYNTAQFLPHCIDSILSQNFSDFELLLIDDGSTDGSGQICDSYAEKDNRIRVFHKENGGVSSARNMGLDNAQGEWINFVDSDDWLEQDFFVIGNNENVDLIYQHRVFADGKCDSIIQPGIFRGEDYLDFLTENSQTNLFLMCYSMLLRSAILTDNHIRFDENLRFGEDRIFIMEYLIHCSSIQVLANSRYVYNQCENWNNKFVLSFHEVENFMDSFMKICDRFPLKTTWIIHNADFILNFIDKNEKNVRIKRAISKPMLKYRKALFGEKSVGFKIKYYISRILIMFLHE